VPDARSWLLWTLLTVAASACSRPAIEVEYRRGPYEFTRAERNTIQEIADQAVRDVRPLLPSLPADLRITVQASTKVMPETGQTGEPGRPGAVYWSVNPGHPGGVEGVAREWLRACLFHEWHHLVRANAGLPSLTLAEMAVFEGLATAFERDHGGKGVAPWGDYPADVDVWTRELLVRGAETATRGWVGRHPDGRRWFGYKVGTNLADRARTASGKSHTELAVVPAAQILEWAGYD
jgi:hypothetical protein